MYQIQKWWLTFGLTWDPLDQTEFEGHLLAMEMTRRKNELAFFVLYCYSHTAVNKLSFWVITAICLHPKWLKMATRPGTTWTNVGRVRNRFLNLSRSLSSIEVAANATCKSEKFLELYDYNISKVFIQRLGAWNLWHGLWLPILYNNWWNKVLVWWLVITFNEVSWIQHFNTSNNADVWSTML